MVGLISIYADYKIAVVGVVEHNGQVLVGKKVTAEHFLSDAWHIPGGSVKENETEEEALIREMWEEAGIKIKVNKFLDERVFPNKNIRARWYLCSPITYDLKAGDDLVDVKFIPKSKVMKICDSKAIKAWPTRVLKYFR